MACHLAGLDLEAGNRVGAFRWAATASTLPDQDMAKASVSLMLSLAESAPPGDAVETLVPDPEFPRRHRGLLTYVRLRRLAVERGFAAAEAETALVAAGEPDLEIARAFRSRWAEPPPRGIDSGAAPLAVEDPLRVVEGEPVEDAPLVSPHIVLNPRRDWPPMTGDVWDDEWRARCLAPDEDPVRLPLRRLAFQLRCWSTITQLEARAEAERDPDRRADLLYKVGAILFHERGVLEPLHSGRGWRPDPPCFMERMWDGSNARWDYEVHPRWERRNLGVFRATEIFSTLRDFHPFSTVADRAAYSIGLAHLGERLQTCRGAIEVREECIRAAAEAFERCARDYPSSTLADDAAAAAAYWRRTKPDAFR